MDYLARKYLRLKKIPSTACSGCGLGQVHKKVLLAIDELGLNIEDIVWGTGIGCAGRQTFNTWKGDNFAGTHGRVYAIATGLRLALPPKKKIILTVGDGDAFGIGLLHLLHCIRRNVDITVIVADNLGYQSTGGQYGWTTPKGSVTDSSPYGMMEQNWIQDGIDILDVLKDAGATFLARHTSMEGRNAVESIKKAIQNRGFSLVQIYYPCVVNFMGKSLGTRKPVDAYKWFKEKTASDIQKKSLPDDEIIFHTGIYHDNSNGRTEFSNHLKKWVENIEKRYENE
ncbi:thiamine pyrophosphate-dependent enzyme [Clostridium luticellarii]|jgi:2-oxoglutarate ferredoxin oxidoreductase subunit beta|uniref:2-oxoglutarate oxidoreductase subunit KorB n=1 Tax=Clostridium luticellarii TaxID=1691940 RepID=A0A2T0BCV1_9CLOT|nr:thiamine pyrophosphate-dependent enzyme [Clostridium luticellarii]PRR81729.1 2-oxoglutarate oxidoreductase subunit KorB [Clostridium luticellarii]